MADITQSFSQLLLTYGPGAMLDLPDHAVVTAGLQDWRFGPNLQSVAEDRLVPLLRQQLGDKLSPTFEGLRQPPVFNEERRDEHAPGIGVRLFPTWFIVDEATVETAGGEKTSAAEKRRRMVGYDELTVSKSGGKLSYRGDGRKAVVNPIRFVAACAKGHLQDIDWRFLVHRGRDLTCRKPLYWVERGVSSDPSDISIRCTCGDHITLGDLYKPQFIGSCRCNSPWLSPIRDLDEECDKPLRLLPRSATNTYFPQTITLISLTKEDSRIRQVIAENRPNLDAIRALPNFLEVIRAIPALKEAFKEFSDQDIARAFADDANGQDQSEANPRLAEFDLLASGAPVIGSDDSGSFLFAETLAREKLDLTHPWDKFLQGVVQVHRLREVTCLYGFTRLEPPPTAAESELDEIQLDVNGADLARTVEWLPAIEQFGEGIFLQISPSAIAEWLASAAMEEKAKSLKERERLDAQRFNRVPKHLGAAYWALHSLSHAFMAELALECGYPLSSLKERIYSSGAGQAPRFAILIYTSTAGGQGTLGGLSAMANSAGRILARAIERISLCSNDPICAEQSEADSEDSPLQGAACHACLLVPETACEARNTRLDRALLVPTILNGSVALFDET
jgi:hypothetical protein